MLNTRAHIENRYIGGIEYHIYIIYRYGFVWKYGVVEEDLGKYEFMGDYPACKKYLDNLDRRITAPM